MNVENIVYIVHIVYFVHILNIVYIVLLFLLLFLLFLLKLLYLLLFRRKGVPLQALEHSYMGIYIGTISLYTFGYKKRDAGYNNFFSLLIMN